MHGPIASGRVPVNGIEIYWESRSSGGTPLIVAHGGFGTADTLAPLSGPLSERRRVIGIELQGHGHTPDADRPLRYESLGDDIAGLLDALDIAEADLLGYSFGAGACLRAAIQHPQRVRRLVVIAFPCRRDGWLPDVAAQMARFDEATPGMLRQTPVYDAWRAVAPDPEAFDGVVGKMGDLLRRPFDWSAQVRELPMPVMVVAADADSIAPAHAAEFFGLLGGGRHDAGWDGSQRPASRLAILPGRTHYDVWSAPELPGVVDAFLAAGTGRSVNAGVSSSG
jgi:pimeloyl-ACP methyl ester carboxylesterase